MEFSDFAAWRRDVLDRAPAELEPVIDPLSADLRYTRDDRTFLRALGVILPGPMGRLR
jgi:hypothetical protein